MRAKPKNNSKTELFLQYFRKR
uniref:Uncharacterized protein n=1 Tax=Anguilla anguilla TaxID=7936 RepID=A0A0E9T962_ANGAN